MKFKPAIIKTDFQSPLGTIVMAATEQGLAGLWFEAQRHFPQAISAQSSDASHPVLAQAAAQLSAYFAGQRTHFDLPLDLSAGTAFQQSVWQALLAIPMGHTVSYGEISRQIDKPSAVRAVGSAIGRNPISIIVPCHRVLGADGSLTGYAGGLTRKSALLKLEGALSESFF